ncbi:CBL-interacting serine/threonine-protein kinase 12-like [Iris pallida]|uniref:CBL-interacting serine/threonine-protein kinase 12-like n=1 Tax=Iris pallida TaxID=29817 RepID=A0AAX6DPH5_IRIPA|nr:CBL-interacting serine/threonine-protein kinase 12-like [Iris pallida]
MSIYRHSTPPNSLISSSSSSSSNTATSSNGELQLINNNNMRTSSSSSSSSSPAPPRALRGRQAPRPRNLREGVPRPQLPHEGDGRHQSPRQGQDPPVRAHPPDQARDLHPPPPPPPQHRPPLRGHGHQVQDLLRHGVRPRRRALRQGRQGPPQGGPRQEVLPAARRRRLLLPRPRRLPQGPQAGEPPPRRQRRPQGLRLRPQRRRRPDEPGHPLPHLLRDPGLRRSGGALAEGLRRGQGRHLVLRGHTLRAHGRLPPLPRPERDGHVQEDLQGGVPLPALVLPRPPPPAQAAARHQPPDEDHHGGDHGEQVVQEGLPPGQVLRGERPPLQLRRHRHAAASGVGCWFGVRVRSGELLVFAVVSEDRSEGGTGAAAEAGELERVRHHIVLVRVRPLGAVRGEGGGEEVRVRRVGGEDNPEAGGDCEGGPVLRAEEGLQLEPRGDQGRGEGPAGGHCGGVRADAFARGGGGEEEVRGQRGVRGVLRSGAQAQAAEPHVWLCCRRRRCQCRFRYGVD